MKKYPSIAFKVMKLPTPETAEKLIENHQLEDSGRTLGRSVTCLLRRENEVLLGMSKGDLASQLGMTGNPQPETGRLAGTRTNQTDRAAQDRNSGPRSTREDQ